VPFIITNQQRKDIKMNKAVTIAFALLMLIAAWNKATKPAPKDPVNIQTPKN
jgi:hypothetical protein